MNETKFLSYLEQYHQWLKYHIEAHKALQKANESINKLGLCL